MIESRDGWASEFEMPGDSPWRLGKAPVLSPPTYPSHSGCGGAEEIELGALMPKAPETATWLSTFFKTLELKGFEMGSGPVSSSGSATADDPIVQLSELNKSFTRSGGGIVKAIDDITLDIFRGEFSVLLGPSGCGKTTLLRSIAGLETPDSGDIVVDGETVFSAERGINLAPERRPISMVFQSYALWPHMTAYANIAYPLLARGRSAPARTEVSERVNHVLQMVGIPDLGNQYPNQMSGGQQQRVALARALVVGTDLILFDEPLSNVDAKVREQLRLELLQMQRDLGFTGIFVTHDQVEAMVLATNIAVMEQGRVAQFGSPRDIYLRPRSRYVASFIGTSNEVSGTVTLVESGRAIVTTQYGQIAGVPARGELRTGTDAVALWRPENLVIAEDEPVCPNRWRGELTASLFLGSHTEHVVNVEGRTLRGFGSGDDGDLAASKGRVVWASVEPADVWILPRNA